MSDFNQAKFNMIEQQIRPWEVLDPQVLAVLHELNREDFVPEHLKGLAYADCRLPVLEGESMLPPTLEGRMLQSLNLKESDSVLEIGCCSGYLTACLAKLAQHVTSVDFSAAAVDMARTNLGLAGVNNVTLQTIDTLADLQQQQQFDAIVVSAGSLSNVPDNLLQALAIDGRLIAITGQSPVKHARLMTRIDSNQWTTQDLFETDIPELAH